MTAFDSAYFDRFYEARASRVYGPREIAHLARGVTGMIGWFGGELRSVLDVGAGTGLWRDWFRRHQPHVRYVSTDASPYACEKYGHELRDITTWRGKSRFDLVVCQGVLPYLDDAGCRRAVLNLAAMARGFLYLEAVTAKDLRTLCDRAKTDVRMRARSGAAYRKMLAPHFHTIGAGLYYAKSGPLAFYELEALTRGR
jgi:hypothetical protein